MRPPETWRSARVTLWTAGVTAAAWALAAGLRLGDLPAVWAGFIPLRLQELAGDGTLAPPWLTPLTATLVHGGIAHLLFNMLILLFCGRAVETIVGGRQFVILYLVGAYAAAAGHWAVDPVSNVPMIGASGAVSAVIGAYAMMFGRNKVKVANPTLALWLNALWVAVAWVILQLIVGLTFETIGTGIAIGAHIGGFLAGMLLAKPLLLLRYRGA